MKPRKVTYIILRQIVKFWRSADQEVKTDEAAEQIEVVTTTGALAASSDRPDDRGQMIWLPAKKANELLAQLTIESNEGSTQETTAIRCLNCSLIVMGEVSIRESLEVRKPTNRLSR